MSETLIGNGEVHSDVLAVEEIPVTQEFGSGSQAGILVGIISGMLLLIVVLFLFQMRYIKRRE